MRTDSKTTQSITIKLIIICLFLVSVAYFVLRSSFSSPQTQKQPYPPSTTAKTTTSSSTTTREEEPCHCQQQRTPPVTPTCSKIAPSLAETLIHYATSNATPQQTLKEVSVTARVLAAKSPCNFLVFGLGLDSPMWSALNHGGRTAFLEEDAAWIGQVAQRFPGLESHHVAYDTKVSEAAELMAGAGAAKECRRVGDPRESECRLALKGLPAGVYDTEWDLIMVDAPTGYHAGAPGRMTAIYTAGLMARNREAGETDVFVHDVDREVEDGWSNGFLCEGYLREQEGRLRHFTIPSHRAHQQLAASGRPFCPPPP